MSRKVLIVDDEPKIADTLSLILQLDGFETAIAHDGVSALELSAEFLPDLVITDVAMPLMSGIGLAHALSRSLPDCKVLLFSGQAATPELVEGNSIDLALPLISKPVHPRELIRVVEEMLGGREAPEKVS